MTGPNAAIGFLADAFTTDQAKLMGRHAASEGLLRGWVRHAGVEPVTGLLFAPNEARVFAERVAALAGRPVATEAIPPWRQDRLDAIGTLLLPDPNLRDAARRRALGDPRGHSILGVTHTTASAAAMAMIADLLTAPVQPWDALICTSEAVRGTVRTLLEAEAARLEARLGATRFVQPRFPVIPLGIDTAAFAADPAARTRQRAALGAAPEEVVALWVGRISWHAKAHPLPHFAALGRAARAGGRRLRFVLAGWLAHPEQERAFREQAAALAPEVALDILDGRDPVIRREIWQAADLFLMLVDNVQETFGLAPVEAMAAGLPVVVSDWDGFRDTVRDGLDGFRIPTRMLPPGSAGDLAWGHASGRDRYDLYIAGTTHLAAVDVPRAAEAIAALAGSPELRARMGAAAAARAREAFDWRVVVARYQALFAELAELRQGAAPVPGGEPRWMDPTRGFAHYATTRLTAETRLAADPDAAGLEAGDLARLPGAVYPPAIGVPPDALSAMLARLRAQGPTAIGALGPPRAALWLLKAGLARLVEPPR